MRDYGCYVYREVDGKLSGGRYACWGAVSSFFDRVLNASSPKKGHETIHISHFDCDETQSYQSMLIGLINEITPCEIYEKESSLIEKLVSTVKKVEKRYIKYKLLNTYDQNLILLNFIRNLWHPPEGFVGYTVKFFKALEESKNHYQDPLQRLTWANREASPASLVYPPGHSNVHGKDKLKIKTVEDLLAFNGYSTMHFLTQNTI